MAVNKHSKLLTLILSFEDGPFRKIQEEGQDFTFLQGASEDSIVIRYVGKSSKLSLRYKILFKIRRWQYALLDFSQYWPIGALLRLLANSRFGDRAVRGIPKLQLEKSEPTTTEVMVPGKPGSKIITNSPEDWSLIGLKTLLAFKYVLEKYDFEYLFRTNTSSYLDTQGLLGFLEGKPKTSFYGGVVGKVFGNSEFASGAGILLSRDVVERICERADDWKHGLVDDIAIADLVARFTNPRVPLVALPRLDLPTLETAMATDKEVIGSNFHFRCKSESAQETIEIMQQIHKVKTNT
jgi:hypothetical protein